MRNPGAYMPCHSGIEQYLLLRVEGHIQVPVLALVREADGAFVLEGMDKSVSNRHQRGR